VLALSPADFGKLIADETEKWANLIKFAGIKPTNPNPRDRGPGLKQVQPD